MRYLSKCLWVGILLITPWVTPHAQQSSAPAVDTNCITCHGPTGNSAVPTFPKLAGQSPDYILKQLTNFQAKSGAAPLRENAIMNGVAGAITEDAMKVWAGVFSSQKIEVTPAVIDQATLEQGKLLYLSGNKATGVPACAGCHGPMGAGLPAQYPRLGGQHASYLEAQLHAFREGSRHNDAEAQMRTIAARMTSSEIKAVAQYLSTLDSNVIKTGKKP